MDMDEKILFLLLHGWPLLAHLTSLCLVCYRMGPCFNLPLRIIFFNAFVIVFLHL